MSTITVAKKKEYTGVDKFAKFLEHEGKTDNQIFEEIKTDPKQVYHILRKFAQFMTDTKVSGASQKTYMTHVRQYLIINTDCDIVPTKFKIYVKPAMAQRERSNDLCLSSSDIARIISVQPEKIQLICMLQICSLRRPGEINKLRVCDFDFTKDPIKITVPSHVSKNGKEGHTFCTPETAKALQQYIAKHDLKGEDVLFGYTSRVGMTKIFNDNLRRHLPDLCQRKANKRFTVRLYSMKKYGYGQIELAVSRDYAKYLKGDIIANESEYSMVQEQKRAEQYNKCIPYLTIYNQDELQKELNSKNTDQKTTIELLNNKIEELKAENVKLKTSVDIVINAKQSFDAYMKERGSRMYATINGKRVRIIPIEDDQFKKILKKEQKDK